MKRVIYFLLAFPIFAVCASANTDTALTSKVEAKPLFLTPLQWTGSEPSQAESEALLAAIGTFETNGTDAGFESLETFLAENPNSSWAPSLHVNMAEYYRVHGNYTRALSHWELAWNEAKNGQDANTQHLAARALAGWTRLLASLGEKQQLSALFVEADKLQLPLGPYATTVNGTKEGLAMMNIKPGVSYRCGSFALGHVAEVLGIDPTTVWKLYETESPDGGFKMAELLALARTNGLEMVALRRPVGAEIIVPSIVHWKLNHFAAITQRKGNLYRVDDPTFEGHVWMDSRTIDSEASGEFIVPKKLAPGDWATVTVAQCQTIYGKGYPSWLDDLLDWLSGGCGDDDCGDGGDVPSADDGANNGTNAASSDCPPCGMPRWIVSEPYITVWLRDVPLLYRQSNGKWMKLSLSYKSRGDAQNPAASGFGNNWSCNWIGMLQTQSTNADTITDFRGGGGQESFTSDGSLSYKTGRSYSAVAGSGGTELGIYMPNRAYNDYGLAVGSLSGSTNYFLSKRVDQYGRTLQHFVFKTTGGLTLITNVLDIDGRTNVLTYGNSSFPYLITAVTDPYGRTANFAYDNSGMLTNIVDAQGLATSFKYDSSEELTNMTTPYGTTTFQYYDARDPNDGSLYGGALTRGVLVTEPSGDHELYVYKDHPLTDFSDMASYHWNRAQFQAISPAGQTNVLYLTNADFLNGYVKHWLHGNTPGTDYTTSDSLDQSGDVYDGNLGTRPNAIQYTYEGENNPYIGGSGALKSVTAIVVNGDQEIGFTRNSLGRATSYTYYNWDSGGGQVSLAVYTNIFDSSGTVLLREFGPRGELTCGYAYHPVITNLLVAVTNAAGDVLRYTYDTNTLKVTSVTFPGGLVRTNIYYSSGPNAGFLAMQADIGFRTNYFSYINGNVYIQTNELGRVTTNIYDGLNRLVSSADARGAISNVYNKLDIVATKDRLNQWTYYGYDALQQLIAETNVDGQVTTYSYCGCGSPDQITRWVGATPVTTTYTYDLNGLVTYAQYPDNYKLYYQYDQFDRVYQVTNGAGDQLNFNYFLAGVNDVLQYLYLGNQPFLVQQIDEYGRITNSQDRNFVTTSRFYDFLDRMTNRVYSGYSGTYSGIESFRYSAVGLTNYVDQLGHTTKYSLDVAGRILFETNGNNEVLQFSYNPADELLSLTDGKNQTTRWGYDAFGRSTNKVDASSATDFVYQYDADSRLTNRWTPAKGNTGYQYDPWGNLTAMFYAHSTNYFAYDPLNRMTNMVDGFGSMAFTWTLGDQLASENGPWPNDAVSYTYNAGRHRIGLALQSPHSPPWTESYGYDYAMRLATVVSPAGNFSYNYPGNIPASDRVVTLWIDGQQIGINNFDDLARETSTTISSTPYNLGVQYGYDAGSEATQEVWTAQNVYSYMNYGYDNIGQLKTAQGYDGMPGNPPNPARLQEQFGYAYDKAWNLSQRTNNALIQSFAVNNVNELTSANRSGTLTVAGSATEQAGSIYGSPAGVTNVTVNGQAASVYGDGSFAAGGFTPVSGNNTYTALAQDTYGRSSSSSVTVSLPSNPAYTYDANGNLLSDGTRNFTYDDENELISVWVANGWSNNFAYDGLLRKRIERDYSWNGSSWVETNEVHFVYDGNLVLQERDGNNLPVTTYTRGVDLSHDSLQGAGGIGGLLARTENPRLMVADRQASAYYFFDGKGNVSALVYTNGLIAAQYKYDPYGTLLVKSGPLADGNRYRFSSKEWNENAGLYYFGYRFYDPGLQRWLNRDLIGERGEINLYRLAENSPINYIDLLGLQEVEPDVPPSEPAVQAYPRGTMPADELMREENDLFQKGAPSDTAISALPEDQKPEDSKSETRTSCPKGGVYGLVDPNSGIVMRTGRTDDLDRREREHGRDPRFKGLDFTPVYRTDDYSEQRGLEQMLHNRATSAQGFPPPFNYNQPIGAGNANYLNYMNSAQSYSNNSK